MIGDEKVGAAADGETFRVLNGDVSLVVQRWTPENSRGVVIMLHGGGQTRHSWAGTARRLAGLGWTAIAMDMRGHGDTDWAPDGNYDIRAFTSDVTTVLDTLGEPAVLVGASLGGIVSLIVAAGHPELLRGLILVDVVVKMEPAGVARILDFMSGHTEGFASLEEAAEAVAVYNPNRSKSQNPEGLRKNLRQREDGRWYWHWDPAFLHVDDETRRKVRGGALRDIAARVSIPTLLVRGRQSDVVSQAGIDDMLTLIPHAETTDVQAAGHMVAGDDNDIFTERLEDFLSRLPPLD